MQNLLVNSARRRRPLACRGEDRDGLERAHLQDPQPRGLSHRIQHHSRVLLVAQHLQRVVVRPGAVQGAQLGDGRRQGPTLHSHESGEEGRAGLSIEHPGRLHDAREEANSLHHLDAHQGHLLHCQDRPRASPQLAATPFRMILKCHPLHGYL